MKKIIKPLFATSLLFATHSAIAGGDTGLYIGAGAGNYQMNIDRSEISNIGATNDFDTSNTGGKLIAGINFGIIPTLDFALEANYNVIPEAKNSGVKVSGTSTNIFALVGVNLSAVGLYAKAGNANWKLKAKGSSSEDLSGNDIVYGIGARFQLFELTVRTEYEQYDIKNSDLSSTSASLLYTF